MLLFALKRGNHVCPLAVDFTILKTYLETHLHLDMNSAITMYNHIYSPSALSYVSKTNRCNLVFLK